MRTKLATADRMEASRTISILKTRDLFLGSNPSSMKLAYLSVSSQKSTSAGDTFLPRCKVSNKQCKIDEFFEKHLGEFKSILDMLNKITPGEKDDELKRMEGVLEKAINYPKNMLDYKNCRKCGDAM